MDISFVKALIIAPLLFSCAYDCDWDARENAKQWAKKQGLENVSVACMRKCLNSGTIGVHCDVSYKSNGTLMVVPVKCWEDHGCWVR